MLVNMPRNFTKDLRLHRHHSGKSEVVVYDYVDSEVPMLMRMMNRRIRGYKAIGYEIDEGHE
jgi:predicted membrane-bound spermidine synthase